MTEQQRGTPGSPTRLTSVRLRAVRHIETNTADMSLFVCLFFIIICLLSKEGGASWLRCPPSGVCSHAIPSPQAWNRTAPPPPPDLEGSSDQRFPVKKTRFPQ